MMSEIRIMFYRAVHGTLLDKAIDNLSGRYGFSHVELLFPDGMSFSSTARDRYRGKPNGTRWKRIVYNADHWCGVSVPVPERGVEAMRDYAHSILDARYDFTGVLHFIPFIGAAFRHNPSRYFCSDACLEVCQAWNLYNWLEPSLTSPGYWAGRIGLRTNHKLSNPNKEVLLAPSMVL